MSITADRNHARGASTSGPFPGAPDSLPLRTQERPGVQSATGRLVLDGIKEMALVGALYLLYKAGRVLVADQEPIARANADLVHTLQQHLHLPSEAAIQAWFNDDALQLANIYYVSAHFPLTIAVLLWGFRCRPRTEYIWARRLLVAQTFLALVIHVAFPLAPPRMFPEWGFLDSMTVIGPTAYDGASAAVANQFAAMPSLHIGWAALIAVVVWRIGPRLLKFAALAHVTVTIFVVVVTANHWWLDGLVAVALLGLALLLFPGPGRDRLPEGLRRCSSRRHDSYAGAPSSVDRGRPDRSEKP